MVLVGLLAAAMASGGSANAAQCGAGPAGFGACKRAFADEARTHGIGAKGVAALLRTTYSAGTIRALDRLLPPVHTVKSDPNIL